jgi:ankyrin repeat protein
MKYIKLFEDYSDYQILTMSAYEAYKVIEEEIEKYRINLVLVKKILKDSVIDVNANIGGNTLLTLSIKKNNLPIFYEILKHPNIDVNKQNGKGDTPLMVASTFGVIEAIQLLLQFSEIDPNITDDWENSPIMVASMIGKIEAIQLLLKHPKTDPNIQNQFGHTALMSACKENRKSVVGLLLAHPHIDTSIQNDNGETAWDFANEKLQEEFPELNPNSN